MEYIKEVCGFWGASLREAPRFEGEHLYCSAALFCDLCD